MPDVPLFKRQRQPRIPQGVPNGDTVSAEIDSGYVGSRYSLNFLYPYKATGEYLKLPSYTLTNLRVGLQSHNGWEVNLFATNIFNKQVSLENLFQETEPSAVFSRVLTNQPLTVGVNLTYQL